MAAIKITHNEQVNDRVIRFSADLLVKIVCREVSVPQAVAMVNSFADSLRGKVPDDEVSDARSYMTDYVFSAQETMQRKKEQPANRPWQESNDDDLPWQEREPWRTIKQSLPPAMIDTPEKERKVAWRIGFMLGWGAEKAAAAAIREYGLTGGAALIALFAWAYQQIRGN